MFSLQDKENITKSTQGADLLKQDLLAISQSDNPLLAELALELIEQVSALEKRLKRLQTIVTGD